MKVNSGIKEGEQRAAELPFCFCRIRMGGVDVTITLFDTLFVVGWEQRKNDRRTIPEVRI